MGLKDIEKTIKSEKIINEFNFHLKFIKLKISEAGKLKDNFGGMMNMNEVSMFLFENDSGKGMGYLLKKILKANFNVIISLFR
jgi:hypothetical protein